MITRRVALTGLTASVLARTDAAYAQAFPNGLVRTIVPFPPGGGTDVLGRLLAAELQKLWKESVIIDNRPGAAGVIGTRQVIAAAPDGQTLLMASTGAILALAGGDGAPRPFDITHELAPVTLVSA